MDIQIACVHIYSSSAMSIPLKKMFAVFIWQKRLNTTEKQNKMYSNIMNGNRFYLIFCSVKRDVFFLLLIKRTNKRANCVETHYVCYSSCHHLHNVKQKCPI